MQGKKIENYDNKNILVFVCACLFDIPVNMLEALHIFLKNFAHFFHACFRREKKANQSDIKKMCHTLDNT